MDLNALKSAAGLPEYLNSINSTSVVRPERRHKREKNTVVSIPPASKFHQSQFPLIPYCPTNSVTAKGVSAANVVATIDIPAIYQGSERPPKKYSLTEDLLLRPKYMPTRTVARSNVIRTIRSKVVSVISLLTSSLEEVRDYFTAFMFHYTSN